MPTWLWRSVLAVTATTALLAVAQWGSCTFYVMPKVWPWYAQYKGTDVGERIDPRPMGCDDIGGRSVATLMGLLTTLISLSRRSDER
jgi:hypothetical protein